MGSVGPQRRPLKGNTNLKLDFLFLKEQKKKLNKKCYYFYCWDPVVMATEGLTPGGVRVRRCMKEMGWVPGVVAATGQALGS